MLFGPGILLAGGGLLAMALLDTAADHLGLHWLGNIVKIILPLVGFAAAIYFLETNSLLRWLK